MQLKHQSNFTVYPSDANNMFPLIFGGAFFSYMDKLAATTVRRVLYGSATCKSAVTHKFEGTFHKPTYVGDLIFVEAEVVDMGKKSVVVEVKAFREKSTYFSAETPHQRELVAEAKFVFVSISGKAKMDQHPDLLPYDNHGLEMPTG